MVKSIKLNDGNSIPVVAFGTGTALYGKECSDLVLEALHNGYISLDTAQGYSNTTSVGAALLRWEGKREDVYILSKWSKPTNDDINNPRIVLEGMLKELDTTYVDIPLVSKHSPAEQWEVLEKIKTDGLARSIGVSNFREEDLAAMAPKWKVPPAVNQIEYSPYIQHAPNIQRLTALMRTHDIKYQAYGPLSSLFRSPGGPVDAVVDRIAAERNATPAQVLLLWAAQQGGGTVVTTSRTDSRQKEQLAAFSQEPLSDADVDAISKAGAGRFFRQFMTDVWKAAKE